MKKVIKAMKKLKLWSRKKKKYKLLGKESPPPPPPYYPPPPPSRPPPPPPSYYHYPAHSPYEPLLPSAPPLPPWLEYDLQFQETPSTSCSASESLDNSTSKPDFGIYPPELDEANDACYQQYMVHNNNTTQVAKLKKLERRDVGAFGCVVVSFGLHLVRCVFPCFHIREEETKFK